jgi:hypothetical protein
VVLAVIVAARPAAAQDRARVDLGGLIEVGGESERYLRALQVSGLVPLTSWSIQPFSPSQAAKMRAAGGHPWKERFDSAGAISGTADGFHLLRMKARLIGNTSFPVQDGGGPAWAGRGLTGELQGGVIASWHDVHLQLAPLAFSAQNASFPLAPNGQTGDERFADARYPKNIDAPQRFGSDAYSRLTPGSSSLTFDWHHLLVSASTAPQRWGPAQDYPLVLGPNAGGFPGLYLGTSEPVNLWLFRAQARLAYGQLSQSRYSEPVAGERRRLGSGLVVSVMPRWLTGLEIGGMRFSHEPWPEGGFTLQSLSRPFAGAGNLFGGVPTNVDAQNEVASVFARWAVPAAKAEMYGEFYKEDYFGKFHESPGSLVEKPDDLAAFTIGVQRVLIAAPQHIRVLRAELVNGESSHQERGERGFDVPRPPYTHSDATQGHTVNGLLLGSPDAYGGSGWRLGIDDFSPRGRRSLAFQRSLRLDWLVGFPTGQTSVEPDVLYSLRAESLRFVGGREYGLTIIPAIDLNRNLQAHHDVFNLTAAVTFRGF